VTEPEGLTDPHPGVQQHCEQQPVTQVLARVQDPRACTAVRTWGRGAGAISLIVRRRAGLPFVMWCKNGL